MNGFSPDGSCQMLSIDVGGTYTLSDFPSVHPNAVGTQH